MKRQFAFLIAMSFLVSGLASFAEEAAQDAAPAQALIVETAEAERAVPFEDGEWMSVPEWNAEVYLPAGWLLTEVTETGFAAADAEGESTMTAVIEAFAEGEIEAKVQAGTEEQTETQPAVEDTQTEDTQTEDAQTEATLTDFESYLMGLGEEYELAIAGEREMAVSEGVDGVSVKFVVNGQLVTLTFASAAEGGIADSALLIAETFYVYDVEEETESIAEEAAAE